MCSYLGVKNLTTISLEGVANALVENQYGETKGIKVHFNMNESGILNLVSVSKKEHTAGGTLTSVGLKSVCSFILAG